MHFGLLNIAVNTGSMRHSVLCNNVLIRSLYIRTEMPTETACFDNMNMGSINDISVWM